MTHTRRLTLMILVFAAACLPVGATNYLIDGALPGGFNCNELGGFWIASLDTCQVPARTLGPNDSLVVRNATLILAGTWQNHGVIDNFGRIVNDAAFQNHGDIVNRDHIENNPSATLTNTGVISNRGAIVNAGTFYNWSRLDNGGDGIAATFDNAGNFENTGQVNNIGSFDSPGRGVITNTGTFYSIGVVDNNGGILVSDGTFVNLAVLRNRNVPARFTNTRTFENYGTFENDAIFEQLYENHCPTTCTPVSCSYPLCVLTEFVENRGVIRNRGTIIIEFGYLFNEAYGSLVNSGTIQGTLENTVLGTVTNQGTIATLEGDHLYNHGELLNENLIRNRGSLSNGGTLINRNLIDNSGSGSTSNNGVIDNECTGRVTGNPVQGNPPVFSLDPDRDAVCGEGDNCPDAANATQLDQDLDGAGDACDCAPLDGTVYPGAPQVACDGVNNDCLGWPGLPPDETDDDSDAHSECDGDCDDTDPSNWISCATCVDQDSDGYYVGCDAYIGIAGPDCDDNDAGASSSGPEINNGEDDQCSGEAGHGVVDEISGTAGFQADGDARAFCWTPQSGAEIYEVARAPEPTFSEGCRSFKLPGFCWWDPSVPGPGEIQYYMIRATEPNAGSYGVDSAGVEREVPSSCGLSSWAETTPVIDGFLAEGEWSDADVEQFELGCADESHEASLLVKNDMSNLYVAVVVQNEDYEDLGNPAARDFQSLQFDNDGDGRVEAGDNRWNQLYDGVSTDVFDRDGDGLSFTDTGDGGTEDLEAAISHTDPSPGARGDYVAEYTAPLASGDDGHDFALALGDSLGMALSINDSQNPCSSAPGDLKQWPLFSFATASVATPQIGTAENRTRAVALGDLDGDGNLDLVAANNGRNRAYLGSGAENPWARVDGIDITTDAADTRAIALGDVDGDGDLDIVAGNTGVNRVYLNNGPVIPWTGIALDITQDAYDTRSIALGDIDADGDLDLISANAGNVVNRVYLNQCSNALACDGSTVNPWTGGLNIAGDAHDSRALVLGDMDGDGAPDLVVANAYGQVTRLYSNQCVTPGICDGVSTNPWPAGSGEDVARSETPGAKDAILGDVDGDGDLDIILGVWNRPNRLYLNDDRTWASVSSAGITSDAHQTMELALVDWDGIYGLDLIVGNWGEPNRLYLNNGTLWPWSGVAGTDLTGDAHETSSVAVGDVDGDLDPDLVVGNWQSHNRFYPNE